VDDIMKIFDFEQDKGKRNNKSKSPENGGTSSGKKANNKSQNQKQPQQSKVYFCLMIKNKDNTANRDREASRIYKL
jgi:hypothetical protein